METRTPSKPARTSGDPMTRRGRIIATTVLVLSLVAGSIATGVLFAPKADAATMVSCYDRWYRNRIVGTNLWISGHEAVQLWRRDWWELWKPDYWYEYRNGQYCV